LQSIDPIIDDKSSLKILIDMEMLFSQNNLEIPIDFRKQISMLRRKIHDSIDRKKVQKRLTDFEGFRFPV
jgi:hypothetical protein